MDHSVPAAHPSPQILAAARLWQGCDSQPCPIGPQATAIKELARRQPLADAIEKEGKAGVNVLFIPVEIGGSYKAENLHKIRVTLDAASPVGVAGSGSGR